MFENVSVLRKPYHWPDGVSRSMIDKEKYTMTREIQAILDFGEVELTITGRLTDGTIFEATDKIKVINKVGKN